MGPLPPLRPPPRREDAYRVCWPSPLQLSWICKGEAAPHSAEEFRFLRPFARHPVPVRTDMLPERSFVPLYTASSSGSSTRGRAARCCPYAPSPFGDTWGAPPSQAYDFLDVPDQSPNVWIPLGNVSPDELSSEFDDFSPDLASLGLEAEALLVKYLGDTYAAPRPPAG